MIAITPASSEPVSLDVARRHLNITADETVDDEIVGIYLGAAREWAESYLGTTLATAIVETTFDALPTLAGTAIALEAWPVLQVVSMIYRDAGGIVHTVDPSTYVLDNGSPTARVRPATTWPATDGGAGSVKVRYVIGYDADNAPRAITAAILLVMAHLYRNREDTGATALENIPMGAKALLYPLRIRLGMA